MIPGKKVLQIDVSDLYPNRYLYTFLKFFDLCGYTVYLNVEKKHLVKMLKMEHEFTFMPRLFKEGFIKIGSASNKNKIIITRDQLSNNYFSAPLGEEKLSSVYHVPMCEFPFYYNILHDSIKYYEISDRKRSVFMAGNIDSKYYNKIKCSPYFDILSRYEVAEFLKQQYYFNFLSTPKQLQDYIKNSIDQKVIIINTITDFRIENENLKSIISAFSFYLAMPGIDMPQAHNLVEAISCGCIPIIHETYATQFRPPLKDNYNAIFYKSLADLDVSIKRAFELNDREIAYLKDNVVSYFKKELMPQAVVGKIERCNFERIHIMAEADSLSLLN